MHFGAEWISAPKRFIRGEIMSEEHILCRNCGAEIKATAKFCNMCGKAVEQQIEEPQTVVEQAAEPAAEKKPEPEQKTSLGTGKVIAVITVITLLLVLAGVGIFMLIKQDSDNDTDDGQEEADNGSSAAVEAEAEAKDPREQFFRLGYYKYRDKELSDYFNKNIYCQIKVTDLGAYCVAGFDFYAEVKEEYREEYGTGLKVVYNGGYENDMVLGGHGYEATIGGSIYENGYMQSFVVDENGKVHLRFEEWQGGSGKLSSQVSMANNSYDFDPCHEIILGYDKGVFTTEYGSELEFSTTPFYWDLRYDSSPDTVPEPAADPVSFQTGPDLSGYSFDSFVGYWEATFDYNGYGEETRQEFYVYKTHTARLKQCNIENGHVNSNEILPVAFSPSEGLFYIGSDGNAWEIKDITSDSFTAVIHNKEFTFVKCDIGSYDDTSELDENIVDYVSGNWEIPSGSGSTVMYFDDGIVTTTVYDPTDGSSDTKVSAYGAYDGFMYGGFDKGIKEITVLSITFEDGTTITRKDF